MRFILLLALAASACSVYGKPGDNCRDVSGTCLFDSDCCSYGCISGACVCAPKFAPCTKSTDCCSGLRCLNYGGNGTPGDDRGDCSYGCRKGGDGCLSADDCCTGVCDNGRCTERAGCTPAGERCADVWDCCTGTCSFDAGTVGHCP
jgi:hypothetical protein